MSRQKLLAAYGLLAILGAVAFFSWIWGRRHDWTVQQHGVAVQYLVFAVGLTAAGVALWYTFETFRLRKLSERQTMLLFLQTQISVRPTLDLVVLGKEELDVLRSEFDADNDSVGSSLFQRQLSYPGWQRVREQLILSLTHDDDKVSRFLAIIHNFSDKLASGMSLVIYDARQKHFLYGHGVIENCWPHSAHRVQFLDHAYSANEIAEQLTYDFAAPEVDWMQFTQTPQNGASMCLAFYRAVDDTLHLYAQVFVRDEQGQLVTIGARRFVV